MARPPSPPIDPAQDAAALLRRIGFLTLMVIAPLSALLARRALVIVVPIGVALLVIAAALDGGHRDLRRSLQGLLRSRGWAAGLLVLFWAALSLAWTPFPQPAGERIGNIAATLVLGLAGYLALPERMRSANLYLVPVGVALTGLLAIGVALGAPDLRRIDDGQTLERGLIVLVMALWPAIAWLRSRGRSLEALGLGLIVAAAALLGPSLLPSAALATGLVILAVAALVPRLGARAVATAMAGLLVLAPLLPFAAAPVSGWLSAPAAAAVQAWQAVSRADPTRLITGHGLETALRSRLAGLIPDGVPTTVLFEVWYELGVVGAVAGAVALFSAVVAADRSHPTLAPGAVAAIACAFALACFGIGTAQIWWLTALVTTTLVFVAVERGQVRTTRPKASFFLRPANDA